MSKKTLLQIVQNILSAMDSDEVNSISDTVESMQVAEIVRETYEEITATLSLPERRGLVQLESVSDPTRPNYLKVPNSVKDVLWLKYNNKDIEWMEPAVFMTYVTQQSGEAEVTDGSGVVYSVKDDVDPSYFTSFDDQHVVFDSYNNEVETTVQSVHSMAYADLGSEFLLEDDYVPELDPNLFPLLQAEAKTSCFINLKQVSNAKEEQRARRQLVRAQNEIHRVPQGRAADRLPNYARRR